MCLAIPGRIVDFLPDTNGQLARVDVVGAVSTVNVGMLEDNDVKVGDYILIHMGFAMSVVSEQEAAEALSMLEMLGDTPDARDGVDELPLGGRR
jgi:hydrogenase expression/formation protein HypC